MKEIKHTKPVFEAAFHKDFRDLINYGADAYRGDDAFIVKHKLNKKDISYEHIKFENFRDHVNYLGTAMLKKGYLGKRIAIIGKNRYEWMLGYFAALCGIGICVPLDKGLPYDELESSLARSYADVLIFDKAHLDVVEELKEKKNTKVSEYICMDEIEGYDSINHMMLEGRDALEGGFDEYLTLPIDAEGTTIILFTSGTTSLSRQCSFPSTTSHLMYTPCCEHRISGGVTSTWLFCLTITHLVPPDRLSCWPLASPPPFATASNIYRRTS